MAVRAARFREALKTRSGQPKAVEPAVRTTPKPKPQTAVQPKSRFSLRPQPRTAPKTTPKAAPKAAQKPVPKPRATRPPEPPPLPVLQRRSWAATLARAAVLTVAIVCMVGFAVALAKVTLVPSPSSDALIHTNLKPGDSIRAYLDQPNVRDTVKQIGGNILLGVPFGVLLPMLFPKARGLLRVAVVTALVMVLVECAQGAIVEGRAFDIDDVILNTAGALIGYLLLGLRLGRALHPRRRHWWQQRVTPDRQPARRRP